MLLSSSVDIAIVPSVCALVVLLRVFGVWFLYCLWAGCGRCVAAGHHCGVRGPYTPVAWPMRLSVAPGKWPALSVPSVAPGLRPPPPGLSRGCSPARCWGCWWPSNSRRRIRPLASGPPVPTGPCPPVRPDIRTQARPLDSPLLHVACDNSRSPNLAVVAPQHFVLKLPDHSYPRVLRRYRSRLPRPTSARSLSGLDYSGPTVVGRGHPGPLPLARCAV